VSARKTLPRLTPDYPPDTGTRIHVEADERSKELAEAATKDDIQQWWREWEHSTSDLIEDEYLDLARAAYQQSTYNRIHRELWLQAKAKLDEDTAAHARATVAAVYGIEPEALDGATAKRLMEDAERHTDALTRAAWDSPSTAAKTAASRAETQQDRLEDYLKAAGLARRDGEYCLVYAEP
jgi:hypothetical protein